MKIVIQTPIQLSAANPYYDFMRGELNLCGARLASTIAPNNGAPGIATIVPQVLVLDSKHVEQLAEVISKHNRSGSNVVTLHRESYGMYRLETA